MNQEFRLRMELADTEEYLRRALIIRTEGTLGSLGKYV